MLEQMRKTREEEQQRDQLRKEFEERQKSLSQEWEKFEREKQASVEASARRGERPNGVEERLRLQVEKELREKLSARPRNGKPASVSNASGTRRSSPDVATGGGAPTLRGGEAQQRRKIRSVRRPTRASRMRSSSARSV
jgi:hypothetical protein